MKSFKQLINESTVVMNKGIADIYFPDSYSNAMRILHNLGSPTSDSIFKQVTDIIKKYFSNDQGKIFQLTGGKKDRNGNIQQPNNTLLMIVNSIKGTDVVVFNVGRIESTNRVDVYSPFEGGMGNKIYVRNDSALTRHGFKVTKDLARINSHVEELKDIHGQVWRYKERWKYIPASKWNRPEPHRYWVFE